MNLFTPAETAANYAAAGVVKTQYAAVKLLRNAADGAAALSTRTRSASSAGDASV